MCEGIGTRDVVATRWQYFQAVKGSRTVYTLQGADSGGFQEAVLIATGADGTLTIFLYPPNHKIGPGDRPFP